MMILLTTRNRKSCNFRSSSANHSPCIRDKYALYLELLFLRESYLGIILFSVIASLHQVFYIHLNLLSWSEYPAGFLISGNIQPCPRHAVRIQMAKRYWLSHSDLKLWCRGSRERPDIFLRRDFQSFRCFSGRLIQIETQDSSYEECSPFMLVSNLAP